MPEGDSVWKLARRLDRQLVGRTIARSDFRTPRLATRDVSGREVLGHDTHGKHLLTRFSATAGSPAATLHSHLKMDGSWSTLAPGKRLPGKLQPHVRLLLTLDDDRVVHGIRLHDLDLVPTDREADLVGHLGPDPLRDDWDPAEAVRRLAADPAVPFVSALLDQRAGRRASATCGPTSWPSSPASAPGRRSARSTSSGSSSAARRCCTTPRPSRVPTRSPPARRSAATTTG